MHDNDNVATLHRKRGGYKAALTRFSTFVTSLKDINPDPAQITELEMRIDKLESHLLSDFERVQESIDVLEDRSDLDELGAFESQYFAVMSGARAIFSKFKGPLEASNVLKSKDDLHAGASVSNDPSHADQGIRLPTIELPKFDGTYERWAEFRDLFSSLIHENDRIKPISKFHYLRASLQGSAAQCVKSIEFSSNNYPLAWDIPVKRFDNKRLMIHNHLKSIFNLSEIKTESANGLRNLVDTILKNLCSLKALGLPTDNWDALVIFIVTNKLDPTSIRDWEDHTIKGEIPTLEEFINFLRSKADFLEKIDLHKPKHKPKESQKTFLAESKNSACYVCKGNHLIYVCPDFQRLLPHARFDCIKQLNLCRNCLRGNHQLRDCKAGTCRKCNMNHHTLLHFERSNRSEQGAPQSSPAPIRSVNTTESYHSCSGSKQVLLSTAAVLLSDSRGTKHLCRALLDCGSMSNYISAGLFRRLGLRSSRVDFTVTGIGQAECNLDEACDIELHSYQTSFQAKLRCLIIPKITENLPNYHFDSALLDIPRQLKLADPRFNEPARVDLLIGVSAFWDILCKERTVLPTGPILCNSKLGWIISGPLNLHRPAVASRTVCYLSKSTADLQEQIERFWAVEEIPSEPHYSDEELIAEKHFATTHRRDEGGRFIVSIPLKRPISELGESRKQALRQFCNLERKLGANPKLKHMYNTEFMHEYESLSHMSSYDGNKEQIRFYSPHHGVLKADSATTKLRVVFNSSALSSTGVSYNDLQMIGPTIQEDLFNILLRFRRHRFVVSADIAKMYRQIAIADEFKPLQLILWRSSPEAELLCYSLNTVTYGTASASFLATRCIKQLAMEHQGQFPLAATIINRDFYVDDLLTGASTVQETILLAQQVSTILQAGCFDLRKWRSNSPAVLEGIHAAASSPDPLLLGSHGSGKTLGLLWSCDRDILHFKISLVVKSTPITKRTILSEIAQIYDPLGLISPCIVVGKILLQGLWTLKLGWDEPVPDHIATRWTRFRSELSNLNLLEVPRSITCIEPITLELHGFSDASRDAYGCSIYVRSVDDTDQVTVRLLCAKSRVAPLKSLTIPRLELCGAHMLAKLCHRIQESLSIKFVKCYLWSDSTVALACVRTSPHLLQTFVSNRVAEIQRLTDVSNWRYVPTDENPADCLSRGSMPLLLERSIWFPGPSFLLSDSTKWPLDVSLASSHSSAEISELRKNVSLFARNSLELSKSFRIDQISSLSKLKPAIAYVIRFVRNARRPAEERQVGNLELSEVNEAFLTLVKLAQKERFPNEIDDLTKGNQVNRKSKILALSPFLDESGILRVGGRLRFSHYGFEKKHPAVLPSNHRLTDLYLENEHIRLCHAGPQLLLASARETVWPISGRNLARRVVRECVTCSRYNPRFTAPIMGNLPDSRLTPSPPFLNTGVDYAGPFTIKDRKGRGCKKLKCYLCLFICLATKAIHLELVTDLSTSSFLETLHRFVSRRGLPSHVYSDNGTNFVGANAQLKALKRLFVTQGSYMSLLIEATFNIHWHFIPAYSPHMGGIWEAGVKSAKHHIRRVLSNTLLTYESFYTILTQIDGILNSRPLTPLSSDPNDLEALTPAHFLIGRPYVSIPEADLRSLPVGRLSHYQHLQQIQQHFWARWSKEYISQLQARTKWASDQPSLGVGSIVLVKDENLPPSRWCLGRVQELHPGRDGVTRVVSVKTATGLVKRSVVKLCALPVEP